MAFTFSELRDPALQEPALHDPFLQDAAAVFPDRAARRAVLHRLLDEHLHLPPEYRDELTNHLPMALQALDALGADESRMRAFAAHYVRRFDAVADLRSEPPAEGDWTALRGRFEAYGSLRARFARELARDGRDAVLRRILPPLLEGVAAQAFHGPIRVAHAIDAAHDGELAVGLAYWAARWQPMPRAPEPVEGALAFDDVAEWLDALDACWRREDTPPRRRLGLISQRVAEATGTTAYRRLGGALRTRGRDRLELLDGLALAGAARYAVSRNLTVLHLVTGARAVRVLAPWLPQDGPALDPLWHAVAAASVSSGLAQPGVAPREPVASRDWPGLLDDARRSDDDHVIKLVHALWSVDATRRHPDGRRAAAVALRG